MQIRAFFVCLALIALAACHSRSGGTPTPDAPLPAAASAPARAPSFAERRARHTTKLVREAAASPVGSPERPPRGVKEVTYRSGDLTLRASFAAPAAASDGPVPGWSTSTAVSA